MWKCKLWPTGRCEVQIWSYFTAVTLNEGKFTPSGHFCLLKLQRWGHGAVLLASSKWRSGLLLDILQCMGQPLHQRIVQHQVPTVLGLRKPSLKPAQRFMAARVFLLAQEEKMLPSVYVAYHFV